MPECTVCPRPAEASLCPSCVGTLAEELRKVPWLVQQLTVTLTRQARIGDRSGPRASETPLYFDQGASVDLETLRDGLTMWAGEVARERLGSTFVQLGERTAENPARWLLGHLADVAQLADAAELHGDVLSMIRSARATIDRPADRRYVGPCEDCGADMYAAELARDVQCPTPECLALYPIEERRAWLLEQAVDQVRTAAQLSRELPWIGGVVIDRKRINQWASRELITKYPPHFSDPTGAPRFRLGEVIDRAREAMAPAKASA